MTFIWRHCNDVLTYRPCKHADAFQCTVYPKKYAHGFCFAVLCCGYTLTDFPISIRLTSLALWQSNDYPSASKATLMNMDKYFMWIHYERLHNHNKAKHNKTVCIFLGIYRRYDISAALYHIAGMFRGCGNEFWLNNEYIWVPWTRMARLTDKNLPETLYHSLSPHYAKHVIPNQWQGARTSNVEEQNHYRDVIMGAMTSQIASPTIVYSTVHLGTDQRIHQSSASLAFVW